MVVIKVTNTVPNGQGEKGHGLALRNVTVIVALANGGRSKWIALGL